MPARVGRADDLVDGEDGAGPGATTTGLTATGPASTGPAITDEPGPDVAAGHRDLDSLAYQEARAVGLFQVAALSAGIFRSGMTMVADLLHGLRHAAAARFSFLLATPVIRGSAQAAQPRRPRRRRHRRPGDPRVPRRGRRGVCRCAS